MASLVPCPACGRHVRIADENCPFCRVAQPAGRAVVRALKPRAKRAVTFVAASIAVSACGATPTTETTPDATSTAAASAAPTAEPAPTVDPTGETPPDAPSVRYGLPPYLADDELV